MELFKKDTTNKFRELGAEVVGDYNEWNLNTPINYLEIFSYVILWSDEQSYQTQRI